MSSKVKITFRIGADTAEDGVIVYKQLGKKIMGRRDLRRYLL